MSALERIEYADGATALTGLLTRPAGTPRAAVLVFPTIMNVTPVIEAKALALAEAGYLALIADFYGAPVADFSAAMKFAVALRADVDRYRARLRAGLSALANAAPGLPKAAIGFCMGGQAVLELARENADIAVATSFHGILETDRAAPVGGPVSPRILVCHGDADVLVPRSQVLAFWDEIDAAGANWHFHSYSGVGHGFTNPNPSPANGATSYDSSADRQSWAAMLSLFDETFGQASR